MATIAQTIEYPAPAFDADGAPVWNIFASKDGVPEQHRTARSYAECMTVCDALVDAGYSVLTDAITLPLVTA